ncbi:MAG TPA: BMP family ABC transporter substrate-binding protein [Gaiellaceae bacterium]|nr:BMP family ABC transporter substrate-binding protein [Gaiellaceae bacterium]
MRKPLLAAAALGAVALSMVAGLANAAPKADVTVALISDIGKFNDRSFNQNQLLGLNRAKKQLGIKALPLQSNSVSDYIPNLTSAVRQHADLVIAAGFLLANATATIAKKFPDTHFAITDYPVEAAPFADKKGKPLYQNVEGLTYAANESGCLVGVLAAKMAARMGKKIIGAVGGVKIPPVDIWIAGYRFCAQKAVPGTKVLIGYSQDFVATDKCKTVAENQISQGAQVLFQVAGGCGLGTLKAADEADIWGIGVDVDQYRLAKKVLTSGVKRVDNGVYQAIKQVADGKFAGGTDLLFNLKNGGMGVGKINPAVPKADIALMNSYKQKIIAGTLKVPAALS